MEINQYLQKSFKGRYIEHLQDFLFSLDKGYSWKMFLFALKQKRKTSKEKLFFIYYCRDTFSLICAKVHWAKKITPHSTIVEMDMAGQFQIESNMFLVEIIYSKEVELEDLEFDSLSEHLLFLY